MSNSSLKNKRIVSGMRSTGRMHLGHYHGVLKNWLQLQNDYECFFFAADLHALTTLYEDPSIIAQSTWDMLIEWLAVGIDPKKVRLFIQSWIPQHSELHLMLSMITPLSWLERVPTYKDQQKKLKELDLSTYGFLGYPLLQTADVALYKANCVPVGEDQVAHIELSREILRRFNYLYGKGQHILTEPESLLTVIPKMVGLDGQKMSKSYHNTIGLREDLADVTKKIRTMPTDPARVKRSDPGEPEKCPVWQFHKVYSDENTKQWVLTGCRSAGIGCLECKQPVIDAICTELKPIQEAAKEYENNPNLLKQIVDEGAAAARDEAQKTMTEVRGAMGLV